eukprot:scaffold225851_cov31-Prasinocladus_malaysianus.AAC.1
MASTSGVKLSLTHKVKDIAIRELKFSSVSRVSFSNSGLTSAVGHFPSPRTYRFSVRPNAGKRRALLQSVKEVTSKPVSSDIAAD